MTPACVHGCVHGARKVRRLQAMAVCGPQRDGVERDGISLLSGDVADALNALGARGVRARVRAPRIHPGQLADEAWSPLWRAYLDGRRAGAA